MCRLLCSVALAQLSTCFQSMLVDSGEPIVLASASWCPVTQIDLLTSPNAYDACQTL